MDFYALMDKANKNKKKAEKKINKLSSAEASTSAAAVPKKADKPLEKKKAPEVPVTKKPDSGGGGPSLSAIQKFKADKEKHEREERIRREIEKKELIKKRLAMHEGKNTSYMVKACGLKSVDEFKSKVANAKSRSSTSTSSQQQQASSSKSSSAAPQQTSSNNKATNFLASIVRQQNQALGKPATSTPPTTQQQRPQSSHERDKVRKSGTGSSDRRDRDHRTSQPDPKPSTSSTPKPPPSKKPSAPPPKFNDLMKMASNPDELKKFQIEQMKKKVQEERERQAKSGAPVINRFTGKPVVPSSSTSSGSGAKRVASSSRDRDARDSPPVSKKQRRPQEPEPRRAVHKKQQQQQPPPDLRSQLKNLSNDDRKQHLKSLAADMSKEELLSLLGLSRGPQQQPDRHLPPAYRNTMRHDDIDLKAAKHKLYGAQYAEDSDEDDEYDSEMDDFIDDTEQDDSYNSELRSTLQSVFKYDKDKYRHEKRYDDRQMEVRRWRDIEKEEKRSSRMALIEDAREMAKGAKDLTGNG